MRENAIRLFLYRRFFVFFRLFLGTLRSIVMGLSRRVGAGFSGYYRDMLDEILGIA